jgi:peptidoglycan lytic transglycosylase
MEVSVGGMFGRGLCSILALFFSFFGGLIVAPAGTSDNPLPALKKDFLKGYKLTQANKAAQAVASLEKVRETDAAIRDYVLFALGRAYLDLKRCEEARSIFSELAESFPDSRWFSLAQVQAESEEACPPLKAPELEEATVDCGSISGDRNGQESADCWFSARQYRKAKEIYRGLPPDPEVLVRLSQAAARTQDFRTAIQANESLLQLFPRSKEAKEAERRIAFLKQDSGDYASAIRLLKALAAKTRLKQEKRQYFEQLGWCHFRLEHYEQAIENFEEALAIAETPRSLYWKGRSLERLGRNAEAEEVFQQIAQIYGATYYGIRAIERLGSRLHGEKTSVEATLDSWWNRLSGGISWDTWTMTSEDSPGLDRISELTALGLLEDAGVEIRRARSRLALSLPEDPKLIRKLPDGRFVFEVRNPRAEDSDYRIPYADHLLSEFKKATPLGLDPLLLYAMMRQESRFRETIVSPAGAIGLLQIMPATGQKLAREAGWGDYRPEWLYDPFTNIDLAVRYFKKLSSQFEGRWYAVAASYNAGEQVVSEWLKLRGGLLEEEFIEEIPYQETRDYVMKVYTNWKAYRVIYGQVPGLPGGKDRTADASP